MWTFLVVGEIISYIRQFVFAKHLNMHITMTKLWKLQLIHSFTMFTSNCISVNPLFKFLNIIWISEKTALGKCKFIFSFEIDYFHSLYAPPILYWSRIFLKETTLKTLSWSLCKKIFLPFFRKYLSVLDICGRRRSWGTKCFPA